MGGGIKSLMRFVPNTPNTIDACGQPSPPPHRGIVEPKVLGPRDGRLGGGGQGLAGGAARLYDALDALQDLFVRV
jgi:hypothetical protein